RGARDVGRGRDARLSAADGLFAALRRAQGDRLARATARGRAERAVSENTRRWRASRDDIGVAPELRALLEAGASDAPASEDLAAIAMALDSALGGGASGGGGSGDSVPRPPRLL